MGSLAEGCLDRAIALFDAANAQDPRRERDGNEDLPKELLYARRMSEMLERFAPEAPPAVRLAVRAQHIERWKLPRSDYPMTSEGYKAWRSRLYAFHADTAARLMREAGCDEETVERVPIKGYKPLVVDKTMVNEDGNVVIDRQRHSADALEFQLQYAQLYLNDEGVYDQGKMFKHETTYTVVNGMSFGYVPNANHNKLIKGDANKNIFVVQPWNSDDLAQYRSHYCSLKQANT